MHRLLKLSLLKFQLWRAKIRRAQSEAKLAFWDYSPDAPDETRDGELRNTMSRRFRIELERSDKQVYELEQEIGRQ